ncbi:hypothetical protein L209DRAFT_641290, partial [Thermothelomyces heterothallicus CBS 203.75]
TRPNSVQTLERARQREIAVYFPTASFPPGVPAAFQEKPSLCTMTRSHSFVEMKCGPVDTVAIGVCKLRNCERVCPTTVKPFIG